MFVFRSEDGTLSCENTFLSRGEILFVLNNSIVNSACAEWSKARNGGYCADAEGLLLKVSPAKSGLVIEIENRTSENIRLNEILIRFSPFEMESPPSASDYLEYVHGLSFNCRSGVKKVGLPNRRMEYNPESSMVYLLKEISSGHSILFSTLPPHKGDYVFFRALHDQPHAEGRFGLEIKSEQKRFLAPGASASVSTLQCSAGSNPVELLDKFGRDFGRLLQHPCKPRRTGWNSWDYFAGAVTAKDVHLNHSFARQRWSGRKLDVVIDEGWEERWGAWNANRKFPDGLSGFCMKVKEEEGIPGVWTAPLLVNQYTDIYRNNPGWFGRDENGEIASKLYSYGPMAYLDVTCPEAASWLYDVFARLKECGFEYFKVDFTAEILKCAFFRDKFTPRGQIIRQAFEIIRRAVGEDAYILACGAPFESVTGLADAVRVSGDIHNFWSHVLMNSHEIASRWWMNGRLWNNDPDFLIVRTEELSTHRQLNREFPKKPFSLGWLAGREMNTGEAMAYALLVYLSGGDILLGDDLLSLKEDGLFILDKILNAKPLSKAAVPVDYFDGHDSYPGLWAAEEEDRWFLGVFNFEEVAERRVLDLGELGIRLFKDIRSFWDAKEFLPEDGKLVIDLKPRSAVGLDIKKNI